MKSYFGLEFVLIFFAFCTDFRAFGDETTAPTHLQIEMVKSIYHDALATENSDDRRKYLREFLTKTGEIGDISTQTNLWMLRAEAALEVNDDQKAWEAGQKLLAFHLDSGGDPKAQKILVALERKDLLGNVSPEAKIQQRNKAEEQHEKQRYLHSLIGTWKPTSTSADSVTYDFNVVAGKLVINQNLDGTLHASGNFSCSWQNSAADPNVKIAISGIISDANIQQLADNPYWFTVDGNFTHSETYYRDHSQDVSDPAGTATLSVNANQFILSIKTHRGDTDFNRIRFDKE